MTYTVHQLINGKIYKNGRGKQQDLYNPDTGEIIGRVEFADQNVVNEAIAAAKTAFQQWSGTTLPYRSRILFKYRELLIKHTDELAKLITREHGKTINDARGSLQRGLEVVEFACNLGTQLRGHHSEEIGTNVDCYSICQPLGVCVGMTPFNFPAMIPLWMFPLAIACGNTFVLKPSEKDPCVVMRLAELMYEAGLPEGVLNVVHGSKETVDALLTHPDVKAISFVGSTPVAEYVYKTGTSQGKRVQAFGGSKNHAVIMPDADLDFTVDSIIGAAFGSAGERCMAISVVLAVGNRLADQFISKMKPRVQNLKIGSGLLNETEMGPLVTQQHWQRVKSYIDSGVEEGAKLVVDGRNFKCKDSPNGFYMGGCLFDDVTAQMRIYKEEIFGPVLSIVRVPDFETALKLVNEHEFGNGAAIFTRDGYSARTFASCVQAGMVGINVPTPVPVSDYSFSGWKHSVFGDIGMYGEEGRRFYTRLKKVTTRWPQSKLTTGAEFEIPTMK